MATIWTQNIYFKYWNFFEIKFSRFLQTHFSSPIPVRMKKKMPHRVQFVMDKQKMPFRSTNFITLHGLLYIVCTAELAYVPVQIIGTLEKGKQCNFLDIFFKSAAVLYSCAVHYSVFFNVGLLIGSVLVFLSLQLFQGLS